MFRVHVYLLVALSLLGTANSLWADQKQDVQEIESRTKAFAAALSKADATAIAQFWTDGGEYIRGHLSIRGREAIQEAFTSASKDRLKLKVVAESDEIRFLSASTAIEEGRFHIESDEENSGSTGYSLLYTKEDGQWSIALLREFADSPSLRDLAWLVGTWQVDANGTKVTTTYKWTLSKKFLRMEYSTESDEGESSGSQMTGMDSETGLPKSWLFTDEGGTGESLWTRDGKKWLVLATGRQSDGTEVTATNVLTPVDRDSFTFQSTKRTIDGESVPDTDVITVKRVK